MRILDILYPPICPLCGRYLNYKSKSPVCGKCSAETETMRVKSPDVSAVLPSCRRFMCVFSYTGLVRDALLQYKFQGEIWMAKPFAALIHRKITENGGYTDYDILAYVPVSAKRLRIRGYDQTLEMLKYISKDSGIPYFNLLSKKASAGDNALEKKNRSKRTEENRYELRGDKEDIKNKRILLVDDILTTGSTLRECTDILLKNGAASVSCVVLATGRRDI